MASRLIEIGKKTRLITERCTKSISPGPRRDSVSPATDFEVDHDAETFKNCHCTNPGHAGRGMGFEKRRVCQWLWGCSREINQQQAGN